MDSLVFFLYLIRSSLFLWWLAMAGFWTGLAQPIRWNKFRRWKIINCRLDDTKSTQGNSILTFYISYTYWNSHSQFMDFFSNILFPSVHFNIRFLCFSSTFGWLFLLEEINVVSCMVTVLEKIQFSFQILYASFVACLSYLLKCF